MHFTHLATLTALAALSTLTLASPELGVWEDEINQGRDSWNISFPNKSPKTVAELNTTEFHSFTNPSLFHAQSELHNVYRAEHNVSDLEWNVTLAAAASKVAETCIFEHSKDNPYGENLIAGFANMSAALEGWASERESFDFDNPKFDMKTGHFTQMVWSNTTQFGCGRAYCGGGKAEAGGDGTDKAPGWMVVCEYSPPGNVEGQFEANVKKGNYVTGAASGLVAKSGVVVSAAMGVAMVLMM